MPNIYPDQLRRIGDKLLQAAGAKPEEAQTVAEHLTNANLAGHDSHGIILIPWYIDNIKRGHIKPGITAEVELETPTTARINGRWGFGYVVTSQAMRMAVGKAKAHNVAAITVYQQGHVGRLASYSMMAAHEGMIGLITCDSGQGPKSVHHLGDVTGD